MKTKSKIITEFFLVFGLLAASFLVDLDKPKFHGDESMWINQSSHFEDFFSGKFSAFTKKDPKNLALTMPTIPEYVIGFGRRAGGYKPNQLNKLWEWNKTYEENNASGNIPSKEIIRWSRFLPSVLSIISIMVTFYLVTISFNALTGYFWLMLTLVNPWLMRILSLAMGEAPLLFNIVMAMLAGFWAIKSFTDDTNGVRASLFWLSIFGIFTGLAGQSKTNGLSIFASGIAILIFLAIRCSPALRWKFILLGLAGLVISTFIFYVAPNPFLWSDPIGKTIQTYQFRIEIMHNSQAKAFPKIVIKDWQNGLQIALGHIFDDLTAFHFTNGTYLNMLLAGFGFRMVIKGIQTTITPKTFSSIQAGLLSIALVGFFASIPNFFTPLNIDRYYMLPLYFVSILIAVGVNWFVKYICQITSFNQTHLIEA